MATSGRVYTGYIADSRFYVDWVQNRQDVAGNYTVISYTIGINNGDWWYTNALKINSVVINGSKVLSNKTYSNITAQGDVVLATGTATIYHGDDGSKSFSISISGWGYDEGTVSGSDSWPLTTIPRKTDISLSASSVYFGNNITINCPKKASGFTNKLYYKINSGSWVTINANAGNSQVFNVAMSLIANIPNDMSCTFTIKCDTYNGSTFIGSSTKTFTASVPSSARTVPVLNKTAILLRDESMTITLEPYAGTWQHVIAYSMGGASGYIQETKTTNKSFTFTPPIDLAQQIPNSNDGNITITVYTYNGLDTLVGSTEANLKVTVPDDIKPSISTISVDEAVQLVTDNFEGFVQNLSRMLVAVDSDGAQGSTITSCKTTVDGIAYLGNEFTSNVITGSGRLSITAIVTDSRGRTSEKFTINVDVQKYGYPSIKLDVEVLTGKVKLNLSGAVSSVNEQNTRRLLLKYRAITEESYTIEEIVLDAWTFNLILERTIDASEVTYEFVAEVADKITSHSDTTMTGKVVMSRRAGGTGVTFGGDAVDEGLASHWDARFYKDVKIDGKLDAFPVGSVICTSTRTNPADKLAGTWTCIDKEFSPQSKQADELFIPSEYVSSHSLIFSRAGHELFITLSIQLSVAGSETNYKLGTFDYAGLGVTNFMWIFSNIPGASDNGNAIPIFQLSSGASLFLIDVIGKTDGTMASGSQMRFTYSIPMLPSYMLDDFCNKFYWVRTL